MKRRRGKKQIDITNINYFPVKKGFAAIIDFKTKDGITGNLVLTSGVPYKIVSSSVTTNLRTATEITISPSQKITISCAGDCGCKVQGTIDSKTGIITYGCSCVGCTATVGIS